MSAGSIAAANLYHNLECAPIRRDSVERLAWENVRTFTVAGTNYDVVHRMYPVADDCMSEQGLITYRYLAQDRVTGTYACLTTTPVDLYVDGRGRRPNDEIENDLRRFYSEADNLLSLARTEQAIGSHYFPRLLSPVFSLNEGHYAYLTEFVPGGSIEDVAFEQIATFRAAFRRAMMIAHLAGIRFFDLSTEDLRVLPNGEVMILDFNVSSPEDGRLFPLQADFDRLDLLLACEQIDSAIPE